jgi:crotonobetainyl-CoA:carnitine CoA-transferase CaiB-like acyl-CoA transferase
MTGLYSTIGILSSIINLAKNGQGEYIDISLFDVNLAYLVNQGTKLNNIRIKLFNNRRNSKKTWKFSPKYFTI